MFAYPFRGAVLGWLIGLSLASAGLQALTGVLEVQWLPHFQLTTSTGLLIVGVIGIVLELLWWLLAFKIAVEALRAAASGMEDDAGRETWVDDSQAVRQFVLWAGLLFVGYLLYLYVGGLALIVYCALLALFGPAIVVLLGMEDSLVRALDPFAWHELLRRASSDYLMVAAKLLVLALLFAAAEIWWFGQLPRWLGVPVSRFAILYVLVAGYHELGRLLDRNRRELQMPQETTIVRPQLGSYEEDLAMRAAERYAAEERFPKAAQQLEPLIRGQGASEPVHARFRELLTQAGDHAGLLQHARGYVPVLLTLGKKREALALYTASVAADPGFELEEPQMISALIALAAGQDQSRLTVTLAQEFSRRFPKHPDLVLNNLAAARLMGKLGRQEEARRLLVGLVRSFPEHSLRAELIAALETLEASARQGR